MMLSIKNLIISTSVQMKLGSDPAKENSAAVAVKAEFVFFLGQNRSLKSATSTQKYH